MSFRIFVTLFALMLLWSVPSRAVTLERTFETQGRRFFVVEPEVFLLDGAWDDPGLAPYGDVPRTGLRLVLGDTDPSTFAPLHYGQVDRIYAYVIVARSGHAYSPSLTFLVPDRTLVPNRWYPRGAMQMAGNELVAHLPAHLKPVEGKTRAFFLKDTTSYYTKEELDAFLVGGQSNPHPVRMAVEAGTLPIACTIPQGTVNVGAAGSGGLRIRFRDPGLAEAPEATAYRCRVRRLLQTHVDGTCQADPTSPIQTLLLGPGGPGWLAPLDGGSSYTLELWQVKPAYGAKPVEPIVIRFQYRTAP